MAAQDSSALGSLDSLLGDRYTREARLAPAFLSILPIFLLLFVWFGNLQQVFPGLLSLFALFGVVRWITHIARGVGTDWETRLYQYWGGLPSTTLLRCNPADAVCGHDPKVSRLFPEPELRQQIYIQYQAAQKLKGLESKPLPTAAEELAIVGAEKDWTALDRLYEPMVAWLRENSRDNTLLFEENISYGFQKNFSALKPFAIRCGYFALVLQIVAVAVAYFTKDPTAPSWTADVAVTLGIVVYIYGVERFVSEESVKLQGFTYARQLLYTVYKNKSDPKPDAATKGKDPAAG